MHESTPAPPRSPGGAAATDASPRGLDERDALAWTITGHRALVVRRLLDRGLTARTLATVLPEWAATIDDVAAGHRATIA